MARNNKSPKVSFTLTDLTTMLRNVVRGNGKTPKTGAGTFQYTTNNGEYVEMEGGTITPLPTTTTTTTEEPTTTTTTTEEVTTTTTTEEPTTTTTTTEEVTTTTTTEEPTTTTTTTIDYTVISYRIITSRNVQSFPGSTLPSSYNFELKDSNGDFVYSDYDVKCIVESIPNGGYGSWNIGVENNSDEYLSVGDNDLVRFSFAGTEVVGPFNQSTRGYYIDTEMRFGNTIDKYIINIVDGEVISIVSFDSIGDVSDCNLPTTTTTTTTVAPTTTTTTTEEPTTTTTTTINYEGIVYRFYNSITPSNSNTTYNFLDMTSPLEVKCAWHHFHNNPNGLGGSTSYIDTQESINDGDYISIGDNMVGSGYTNPINDGYYSYYDGNAYLGNPDIWVIKIENGEIVSMDSLSSLPSCDDVTTTTTVAPTTTTTTTVAPTTTTTTTDDGLYEYFMSEPVLTEAELCNQSFNLQVKHSTAQAINWNASYIKNMDGSTYNLPTSDNYFVVVARADLSPSLYNQPVSSANSTSVSPGVYINKVRIANYQTNGAKGINAYGWYGSNCPSPTTTTTTTVAPTTTTTTTESLNFIPNTTQFKFNNSDIKDEFANNNNINIGLFNIFTEQTNGVLNTSLLQDLMDAAYDDYHNENYIQNPPLKIDSLGGTIAYYGQGISDPVIGDQLYDYNGNTISGAGARYVSRISSTLFSDMTQDFADKQINGGTFRFIGWDSSGIVRDIQDITIPSPTTTTTTTL